jgi:hypothetical protein
MTLATAAVAAGAKALKCRVFGATSDARSSPPLLLLPSVLKFFKKNCPNPPCAAFGPKVMVKGVAKRTDFFEEFSARRGFSSSSSESGVGGGNGGRRRMLLGWVPPGEGSGGGEGPDAGKRPPLALATNTGGPVRWRGGGDGAGQAGAPLMLDVAVVWLDFLAVAAVVGDKSSPTSARDAVSSSAARLDRPVVVVAGGLWDCDAPVPIYPRANDLVRL